jgi:predicted outer membrane repeat protein
MLAVWLGLLLCGGISGFENNSTSYDITYSSSISKTSTLPFQLSASTTHTCHLLNKQHPGNIQQISFMISDSNLMQSNSISHFEAILRTDLAHCVFYSTSSADVAAFSKTHRFCSSFVAKVLRLERSMPEPSMLHFRDSLLTTDSESVVGTPAAFDDTIEVCLQSSDNASGTVLLAIEQVQLEFARITLGSSLTGPATSNHITFDQLRLPTHLTNNPLFVRTAISSTPITITVMVNFLLDSPPNSSSCDPAYQSPTSECNLRSAFTFCNSSLLSLSNLTCVIILPPNSQVLMNRSLGVIEVKADSGELSLVGNDSKIRSLPSSEHLFQFLAISSLSPDPSGLIFRFTNCSISGFGDLGVVADSYGGALFVRAVQSVFLDHLFFSFNFAKQWGGAVFLANIVSINLTDCIFLNNSAPAGGGIVLDSVPGGQIKIIGTEFLKNFATSYGGGILFSSNNDNIQIIDCTFSWNYARTGGGGVAFQSYNTNIQILETTFLSNAAQRYSIGQTLGFGGALFFGEDNSNVIIHGGLFDGNNAALGGVLVMHESNSNFTISDCNFTHSVSDSEASVMRLSGSNISVMNCNFSDNSAVTTEPLYGAVQLTATHGIELSWCIFEDNYPSAFHAFDGNEHITIRETHFFSDPNASERAVVLEDTLTGTIERCVFQGGYSSSGSAIFAVVVGTLVVSDSQFITNKAEWGGAVYAFAEIYFSNCLFLGNQANESGGAVYHGEFSIIFDNCQFLGNKATQLGGAIISTTQDSVTVNASVFENNLSLEYDGGAIYSMASYALIIHSSHFINNTAESGTGAISVEGYHYVVTIQNTTFVSNVGKKSGGLYIGNNNVKIFVSDCEFIGNIGYDGGGLNLGTENENHEFLRLRFVGNVARSTGGGLYIGSANIVLNLIDCYFEGNTAQSGGGLSIESENYIEISNCTFIKNTALQSGGGIFFLSWNKIILKNSSFLHNIASEGGGLSVYSDNTLFFLNCNIFLNRALKKGGGLYLAFQNKMNIYSKIFFQLNIAQEGGGIYLQSGNDNLWITNSTFLKNIATANGGGIFMQDLNLDVMIENCFFELNSAKNYGGGVMLQSSNYQFTMSSSYMFGNFADLAGGSIHSSLYNVNIWIKNTEIWDSHSQYGGSIYLGNDHKIARLENVLIAGSSGYYGGGVYVSPFNAIFKATNVRFLDCAADEQGAALYSFAEYNFLDFCEISGAISQSGIYISGVDATVSNCLFQNISLPPDQLSASSTGSLSMQDGDRLTITSSVFRDNYAYFGGAITTGDVLVVDISGSMFIRNRGNLGGAVGINSATTVTVFETNFIDNFGDIGGALFINVGSTTNLTSVVFDSNRCNGGGGALALYYSDSLMTGCSFTNNTSLGSGSAVYLDGSVSILVNNNFSLNSVIEGGGALFWRESSSMKEPSGLTNSLLNHFNGNKASYGPNWATQGCALHTPASRINITTYGVPIPTLLVTLLDWYQQIVNTDSQTSLEVIVSSARTCNGLVGYATGGLTEVLSNGVANFSSMQVYCAPGSSLSLTFQAVDNFQITGEIIVLQFRSCVRGEYYSAQECVACEVGTYSLSDNTGVALEDMDQISICKSCPPHTSSCYGDVLVLKKGHWRISVDSDRIQSCPYGDIACQGGETAGDESCALGYEGPLCAVCSSGYALKSSTKTCVRCSGSSGLDISDIIFLTVVGLILIGLTYFFTRPEIRSQIRSMDDFVLFVITKLKLVQVTQGSNKKEVIAFANILSRRLRARVKVYVTMYQILSALPFVLDLAFPSPVNLIISGLSFINISISNSAVVSCSTQSYDFIDSLLVDTIYPIVVVAILFCIQWVHITILRTKNEIGLDSQSRLIFETRLSNISSTYFTIFLVFTYLILPSVVTKIFQTFRFSSLLALLLVH